ncbi:porin [Anaerosinus massiliensis]|uniref:porin n=1 Tax=Massilibacillus massiliensis TaxID=1806837 RepID=UPI0018FE85B1|nr:porin [Massilibacillus massiliensis]
MAVTTALTVAFAVPAFANPFADVEQGHWAYDAVEVLAKDGVIEGYGDGTFQGDKTITRYEMAQMVAKAMHKDLDGDQKATVEKLAKEFSSELKDMGIAVDEVKAEQERAKITGDARIRYGATDNSSDDTDFRARIGVTGKINDDLTFNTRLSSGNISYNGESDGIKLDTANVGFHALGLENTIGRQDVLVGTGMILDDKINGIQSEIGGLKVFAGNQTSEKDRLYGAELQSGIFNLNYIKADAQATDGTDKEFYGANASFDLVKNVSLNAEYNKEDNSGDDAIAYGVNFNKLGLSATYKDVEAGAVTNYSNNSGDISNVSFFNEGYKGMEYKYTREVADNTTLTLKYQDFKNQAGDKNQDRTAAYLNVKF